jgi:benzylsuccinate CoA-transferase BbsF subunit
MLLADWGADVIKIEWWHRMDGWRGLISVKDDVDGDQSYNKKPNWLRLNRNKRSLTLNLKNPDGKQIFLDLARKADVVVDNFSAGVMDRLGLGYKDLSPENPGIITISMPGFGTTGPDSSFVGNGPVFEGYSGLASITGYPGGAPRNSVGIWPDVVAGVHGAAAIGMALVARQRTNRGDHIELAQTEALINMIGDAVIEYSANGDVRVPTGNSDHTMAPHGVYPCIGEDRWIAIAVASDAEWVALCETSGGAMPSDDPRFSTSALRSQNATDLDNLIATWTSSQDCWDLADGLQSVGVDAAAVATHDDFAQRDGIPSPEYQLSCDNEYLDHYPGPAARLNGTPPPIRKGPPKLGEHTGEILQEHLGMSSEKIEELRSNEAI